MSNALLSGPGTILLGRLYFEMLFVDGATLKIFLDIGSQLAFDRPVTGSLTGRRSLFQACPESNWEQTFLRSES